ncbi:MAG: ABC transporter permease [Armatimonadota bacterium]
MNPLIGAAARLATPLLLAAMGGVVSEKSGVAQLALEGMMLVGAYTAVAAGGGVAGIGAAVVVAACAGGAMGALIEKARAPAILAGVGGSLLAAGVTTYLLRLHGATGLHTLKVVPSELFLALATASVVAVSVTLGRTPVGLRLRACGENPVAAAAAGIPVARMRIVAVSVAGGLAGCAGAALSLARLGEFSENMTNGRGYLALVAVLLGRWKPVSVAGAALLFGFGDALQLWMRNEGSSIPADLQELLPYAAALVALAWGRRGTGEPKSLARDGA